MLILIRRLSHLTISFGYSGKEEPVVRERMEQMLFEYQEDTVI